MTYYCLYKDNMLVGINPFSTVHELGIPGVSITEYPGEIPNLNKVSWNIDTLSLIENNPRITKLDFMSRFTIQERIAIQLSTDPILKDAMNLLQMAEFIDVTDQRVMMTVGYLAMTGVIANNRVAEVLA